MPLAIRTDLPSRQIGQASSSSVADFLDSIKFVTSDFLGERSKELDCVLESDSSRSSNVGRVSKLPPLTVSLKDSESAECGHPKTTSYGKGAGGALNVSGTSRSKLTRTAVIAEAP